MISSHILSEISLLADDIGIIDHGVLLEEESLTTLKQKNNRFIHLCISDTAQAARILEEDFQTRDFKVTDTHTILLFDLSLSASKINEAFIHNHLEVSELHLCENSLEDYFKKVTGGEGIA